MYETIEYKIMGGLKGPKAHNQCKVCNTTKDRVASGKRLSGSVIYLDNFGRLWRGKTCPDCHAEQTKNNKPKSKKRRSCDSCGDKCDSSRYFRCIKCVPVLRQDLGEYVYS